MTDYAHIALQFKEVMLKTDLERLDFLEESRWIEYQAATKLRAILDGLLRVPDRTRMPNLLVVGQSNSGKTSVVTRFKNTTGTPYVSDDAVSVRPVIYIEIHKPDERELYSAILREFWAPHNPAAALSKLRDQALHLMRKARTRMLIIDEIHTANNGTPRKAMDVMNEIKMLSNTLHIPLVLVGTRTALQLLMLDPQYTSRFEVVALPEWTVNADLQRFLKSFESVLPLKKPSRLFSPELTPVIHRISGGNTGNIEYLLRECAKEAIRTGSELIDRSLLEKNSWMRPTSADGVRVRTL
ncbi:AAA family ATPase [Pseudomonas syringae]|uniref:TniB family NTP-binding protein n=1 Tax=Pseudomonas syringae TaxID=317 RepID=UPI001F485D51|nr:TniB family NTP-binding protein [Pseudomonas syringae]MCF5182982.1 AAA family ATPase [Pseudomonas syringae]MCF5316291.1 AAA family ATPase [Pseudomonas syringae]MCF5364055.1 AAA family ATPase [Pseudomonas syringae]MCF5392668.1 AAA family ATPase [Pseudomonas syringae]MCF5396009.1 AAA family ATPase [Pseudomonas syringae]